MKYCFKNLPSAHLNVNTGEQVSYKHDCEYACLLPMGHNDRLVHLDAQPGGQGSLGMYEGISKV